MNTKFSHEEYNLFGLSNGNVVIEYNKSDSSISGSNAAYFIVVNQSGSKVVSETKINTYSGSSLNRYVSMTQLSNGNIAFSWQRGDNQSFGTRVFTTSGTAVTDEILVASVNGSQSSIAASNGTFIVEYSYNVYVSGYPTYYDDYKIYNNSGTLKKSKSFYLGKVNNNNAYVTTWQMAAFSL